MEKKNVLGGEIIDLCKGCERTTFDEYGNEHCRPYPNPSYIWRNYKKEDKEVKIMRSNDSKVIPIHYHYCPLATHLIHITLDRGKINPLKASKRKGR